MTQEDKQLLLKDLYAKLQYSVFGLHRGEDLPLCAIDDSGAYMVLGYDAWFDLDIIPFKPYLRPMSSMTEDEKLEIKSYLCSIEGQLIGDNGRHIWYFDYLQEHHFDFRKLIEKGLALEAKEGMYEI